MAGAIAEIGGKVTELGTVAENIVIDAGILVLAQVIGARIGRAHDTVIAVRILKAFHAFPGRLVANQLLSNARITGREAAQERITDFDTVAENSVVAA